MVMPISLASAAAHTNTNAPPTCSQCASASASRPRASRALWRLATLQAGFNVSRIEQSRNNETLRKLA